MSDSTKRKLKPRANVPVAAVTVTQLTCLPLLGIDPRRFLEFVHRARVPSSRVGKLVVVDLDTLRTRLAEMARDVGSEPTPVAALIDRDEPESGDDVLAQLGRRRRAGGARG